MQLIAEVCHRSLNKHGQELCGDCVKVTRGADSLLAVLSDGLGSGVKANILATLTTEIISTLFRAGADLEEMVDTMTSSLPVCKVRQIAYATFTIIQIEGNQAYLVEYDSPGTFWVRDGRLLPIEKTAREVHGRKLLEARFEVMEGDYLVSVSDGVVHAGIGGLVSLGWGEPAAGRFICDLTSKRVDTQVLAMVVLEKCREFYQGKPGDDTSVLAMRVRRPNQLTVLTGAPAERERDVAYVAEFMGASGAKAVCGGTTANIVSRVLKRKIEPRLEQEGDGPPSAWLPGVGLVTEGIVTLHRASQLLRDAEHARELPPVRDGATELARLFLNADTVRFMVGDAVNPMQVADVIRRQAFRQVLVDTLVEELRRLGKVVEVSHY